MLICAKRGIDQTGTLCYSLYKRPPGALWRLSAALFFFRKGNEAMSKLVVPDGYRPVLSIYETQTAIGFIKRTFEDLLSEALNVKRVSAPLFVDPRSGLNDDLSGVERPVEFDVTETGECAQIVHSLAKWKRLALHKYGFPVGGGLYTDMNAIRRDEEMDNLHSVYVDQWDWEKVIGREDRNEDYLRETVRRIVGAVCDAQARVNALYPQLHSALSRDVYFVTAQALEDMYPSLSPKEREDRCAREHKTVFIMQIGGRLKSGGKHDGRAPDYDDWALNGDILCWSDILQRAVEVSSMGIRVDEHSLDAQLSEAGCDDRRALAFHKMLLAGALPLTMGGGIGQSRLCLLLLQKAHIGEVQVSLWDTDTVSGCTAAGIELL